MAEDRGNVCRNKELLGNLEKMLNNETYSDTVFFVNKMKFYASSHLVSVSSIELESMMKIHYENCKDREIKLGEIAFEGSFLVILRFMYGLEIDLSQMEKAVLCEVLCLAERFKLDSFFTQLKNYLSKLEYFELDFVVELLNTARKYKIEELSGKLTVWAFENAGLLVNHESFASLQYDVLSDLVKADSFCTQEVNILKGVLQWHFNTMMSSNPCEQSSENAIQGDIMEPGTSDEYGSSQSLDQPDLTSVTNENTVVLMKEFSTNVLKSLLSHIRCSKISMLDMSKLKTEKRDLYNQYKDFLDIYDDFSSNTEPRKFGRSVNNMQSSAISLVGIPSCSSGIGTKNSSVEVPAPDDESSASATNLVNDSSSSVTGPSTKNILNDIVTCPMEGGVMKPLYEPNVTRVFTVNCTSRNRVFESEEELITPFMKWKICGNINNFKFVVYLKRTHMHNIYPKCELTYLIKNLCGDCGSEMFFSIGGLQGGYGDYCGSAELHLNRSITRLGTVSYDCDDCERFASRIFEFTIMSTKYA